MNWKLSTIQPNFSVSLTKSIVILNKNDRKNQMLVSEALYMCWFWSLWSKHSNHILICEQFNRNVQELLLPYDAPMARLCLMERETKIWTAFLDSRSSCFVVLFKSTEGKDDCFIVQKDHTFAWRTENTYRFSSKDVCHHISVKTFFTCKGRWLEIRCVHSTHRVRLVQDFDYIEFWWI